MVKTFFELLLYRADYACKVMSFRRLSHVAGARILGGFAKIFEGGIKVDQVIKAYICYRSKDTEVGIISFFRLEKIRECLLVPAVQVGFFGSTAIGAGLSFKFGKSNFVQEITESLAVHLELPDNITEEEVKICI